MIQIASLTPVKLEPYMDPRSARTLAFEFAPSQTLARGTVIAQLTAGGKAIAYAVASAKEVQTITITGTPTGGTFTLTLARGGVSATTAAIAYNATAATVQAALEALVNVGAGRVAVSGGPGPGTAFTATFDLDEDVAALTATASLTGGTTPGVTIATTTAGVAANDGSQTAIGFLVYDIVVDSNGNITFGPSGATPDMLRGAEKTAPVYVAGTYLQSDLTGLDAAAIRDMKARTLGVGSSATISIG